MLEKETSGTIVTNSDGSRPTTVYGGFQCDDMGLGKTIQILAAMVNNPKPMTLIIAPLAMIETWTTICEQSMMRVFQLKDHVWQQTNPGAGIPRYFIGKQPCVYITNYEKVVGSPLQCNKKWDRIVLDEAHKIRNGRSDTAFCIRHLEAPIRWAVTGTPLVNNLQDIVSLLAFIGVPCSYTFAWSPYYFELLPKLLIHRSLESLRSRIAGAPPLPEIMNEILPFSTPEEEEFYIGVQCKDDLLSKKYARDVLTNAQMLLLLLRLRQLAAHPQLYINAKRREDSTYDREDWLGACTKFDRVIDIIKKDDDTSVHKYIIFCQFNEEMEFLEAYLNGVVPEVLCYNGSMNQADRTAVLKRSKETQHTTVLLIQLQAGGVGLNLQEYDRIIFMGPWWTSALMDQAIARAVRMGQTKVVKVYHLCLEYEVLTPGIDHGIINIDQRITQKADEKRVMLKRIFAACEQAQNPEDKLEPGESQPGEHAEHAEHEDEY